MIRLIYELKGETLGEMSEVRFPVLPGALSGIAPLRRYNQKPAPAFSGGDVFQRASNQSVSERATGSQPMSPLPMTPVRFGTQQSEALRNIFFPKSIAVIGASPDEGTIGRVVMDNLLGSGFTGTVYPVNPKHGGKAFEAGHAQGGDIRPFSASAKDLPDGAVDMAMIMSPKQTVPAVIRALGEKGVRSVVVISAGFNESAGDDGKKLEEDLKKALAEYGMIMIGPNCVGVASTSPTGNMNATFVSGEVTPGNGAIMSQSGAVSIDLIQHARLAGLGFSQMASIGNQTNVDSSKLIAHWKDDPSVKYILGYLESVKDPEAFRQIATEVSRTKPIVLIKSGKSSVGAQAASSHTGSLAGSDTAVDSLFTQSGVQRVDSIEELFCVAKAFEQAPPLKGNRVGIVSNSGGYGVMVADIIETGDRGLKVATLSDETRKQIAGLLPAAASARNPVDTIATTPSDNPENFRQTILAMAKDPNVDAVVVTVVPLLNIEPAGVGRILAEAQQVCDKPIIGVISTGESELLGVQQSLEKEGLKTPPLYRTLENAMTGLAALEAHRVRALKPDTDFRTFPDVKPQAVREIIDKARAEGRPLLTTTESLHILEAYGIKTASHALVNDPDREAMKREILKKAEAFGYPAAIKFVSKTITHKTDIGGVAFDLKTPEALAAAFDKMMDSLAKAGVKSFGDGEGIMVQQSIPNGRETLIGFKEDDLFGNMIAFGLGGIYVNIFKDVKFRLAPLTEHDADEMITTIKGHKILSGYRGKPSVDFETLKETLLRYSQLAVDFPELAESDINPFFAQPRTASGEPGGVAVDARFTLHDGPALKKPGQPADSGAGEHRPPDKTAEPPTAAMETDWIDRLQSWLRRWFPRRQGSSQA